MKRLPVLVAAFLIALSSGATLRADDKECARLQKESEEIDQKIGDAIKKNDETARKHWEEERFKIAKPLRKCTCDHLRRDKEAALEKAQSAATSQEREKWSETVVNLNRILKELCEDGKETTPYDPCWIEKYRADLARIVANDSPENKKKHEESQRELCRCSKKFNLPLPKECEDAASTLFPGDRSVCDSLKKDYDEKQKALQNSGGLKGAALKKVNDEANESRDKYCQCLLKMKVKPLPEDCQGTKLTAPPPPPPKTTTEPPPKTGTPPPPDGPKVSPVPPVPKAPAPVPPPSKTVAPPPPPPASTAPPPPPPKSAPPPPPSSGASAPPPPTNYVCGKSPCDCAKQNPPKKCTTASGCVCTKG